MHLKRNKVPKIWPLKRKGSKYLIAVKSKEEIPVLIALREMLSLAKNRKDVKKMLNFGKIKVNGKIIKDEKFKLALFDNLDLDGKKLRLIIKNKKFFFEESKGKEKISKVIGRKMLNDKKMQINLRGGRNCLSEEKVKSGDSVITDIETGKIKKILELKTGAKIMFISGKYSGEEGKVEKVEKNNLIIDTKNGKINANLKNIIVIE